MGGPSISEYEAVYRALEDISACALDLTLSAMTTDNVPQDIRKRAFVTHRKILEFRDKYGLKSLGEIERDQVDPAIDNPNCNDFGEKLT